MNMKVKRFGEIEEIKIVLLLTRYLEFNDTIENTEANKNKIFLLILSTALFFSQYILDFGLAFGQEYHIIFWLEHEVWHK